MHPVTYIPGTGCDDELYAAWMRLAAESGQIDPFCCTPTWQLAFHEVFFPRRRLFVTGGPDAVIAFAESWLDTGEIFLGPLEDGWLFGCPLLGCDAAQLLAANMEALAAVYAPEFPYIVISGIRTEGELARQLWREFGGGFRFFHHDTSVVCSASLEGGVDGFLSRRSANLRSNIRKAARRAREKGVQFERVLPQTLEQAQAAYARMLDVESRSWKGLEKCGMNDSPSREFYESVLRRSLPEHGSRIMFAVHEGRDIGFIFGNIAGDAYRGQQFSYDAAWKDGSIGNLMQMEQIAWLCEEGARRYDMGSCGDKRMAYKCHWTEDAIESQTWILAKS